MPKPKALNRISDINVAELTLCKNPAVPAAGNIVLKTEDAAAGRQLFNRSFAIKSTDAKKKQIFLYFLAPDDPDLQGDVVSAEEVEKACHTYMKNLVTGNVKGLGTGSEHQIFKDIGYPIQCAIDYTGAVGKAAGCAEPVVGGWWVGIQCTDQTWEKVEKGEIKGGSIGGVAVRTPIEDAGDGTLGKTFRGILDGMVGNLRKQESGPVTFDEAVAENENRQKLWDITDALHTSIYSIINDDAMQKDAKIIALGASIDQFKTAMLQFLAVQKAISDITAASAAVIGKSETVLTAARDAIDAEIQKLHKNQPGDKPDNGGNDMDPKELLTTIEAAVTKAVKPLQDEVTTLKTKIESMETEAKKAADEASDAQVTDLFKKIEDGFADYKTRLEKLENKPAPRQGESPEGEVKKTDEVAGAAGRTILG